uniref:Uncharacterized protein n=1 Tax=Tetranychus urticae TaxID=32264 RepID=T1L689_TETUR
MQRENHQIFSANQSSTSPNIVPDESDQADSNTGAAKTRPEVFQAISPMRASKATSASNPISKSFSSMEDDADDLPNWLRKPVDFPKKNDIWQVLYDFTLNYLKTFKSKKGCSNQKRTNNYDYIDDIVWLFSKAKVCEGKCAFKKPHKDMTGRRHIINTVLGMTYYCTKCGVPFKGKSNLVDHSNRCPYRQRVALENAACREDYKEYTDQQTKKARTENPVPIPIIEKLDEKFIDYLKLTHQRLRHSGLISINNFTEFLNHRSCCTKTVRWKTLVTCRYTSIHTLSALRADIITENTKTSWIDGCVRQNTFTTDDARYLVGHIAEKNYLIICEGCHRGVADWMFFLEHFTEDCFITRPVKKN